MICIYPLVAHLYSGVQYTKIYMLYEESENVWHPHYLQQILIKGILTHRPIYYTSLLYNLHSVAEVRIQITYHLVVRLAILM